MTDLKPLPSDIDVGTPELHLRHDIRLEGTEGRWSQPHAKRADPRHMDRYKNRDQLDPKNPERNQVLYDAGYRLLVDWTLAGLEPRMTANLMGAGGKGPDSAADMRSDANKRKDRALKAVEYPWSNVLINVVCQDMRASDWAALEAAGGPTACKNVGMYMLRKALERLADHYGM